MELDDGASFVTGEDLLSVVGSGDGLIGCSLASCLGSFGGLIWGSFGGWVEANR